MGVTECGGTQCHWSFVRGPPDRIYNILGYPEGQWPRPFGLRTQGVPKELPKPEQLLPRKVGESRRATKFEREWHQNLSKGHSIFFFFFFFFLLDPYRGQVPSGNLNPNLNLSLRWKDGKLFRGQIPRENLNPYSNLSLRQKDNKIVRTQ